MLEDSQESRGSQLEGDHSQGLVRNPGVSEPEPRMQGGRVSPGSARDPRSATTATSLFSQPGTPYTSVFRQPIRAAVHN